MQFLEDLSRGPPSRLKEYQTITGFNHNPHVWFLQEDLRRLLPWENITYDSMHCFFSNGICCQEIGNFYTACLACQRVSRQHILDFIDIGWLSRLCICTELAEREAFESRQRLSGRCCSNNWAACSVCWLILPKQLYLPMFCKQKSKVTWPFSTW